MKEKKLSWATVDVGRACIEANANLVVVYNSKKSFWPYEGLVQLAAQCSKALSLIDFCSCVEQDGDPCKSKKTKNHFSFVARYTSKEQALEEAEEN